MINILSLIALYLTSFHSLSYTSSNGSAVPFSIYQGKKVLIVNMATGSPKVSQIEGLQELQERFGDSLVIIAFPSNSFGNEPKTDAEIMTMCIDTYGATFKIAQKGPVVGNGMQQTYSWLAQSSENGTVNGVVSTDFQKFLIDGQGNIVGYFSSKVEPMDSKLIAAISAN
jgi:glutathione peroxidase